MRVTDQLATLADTLRRNGAHALKPGIWRLPDGGYTVRTGYVMGEVTFWLEDEKGRVVKHSYYRGDDLLSFLLTGTKNKALKNLGDKFVGTLDMGLPLP